MFWVLTRLVKLAARAFYDDITTKGDNQPKTARGDNRGMAVVVLDSLTRSVIFLFHEVNISRYIVSL